jgi:diguanylate cyclase (GGDEF)-like protein/PAS domain S-box-containing protein
MSGKGSVKRDASMSAYVAIPVAVALVIAAATALILWHARVDPYRRADAASQSVLQAISKDLDRSIGFNDVSLRWAISALSTPGFAQASEPVRRQMLFAGELETQSLGRTLITDNTGRVLYESGVAVPSVASLAGRQYFATLRDHPGLDTVLSRPFEATNGDGLSIALARRLPGADGDFGGAAVSIIPLRSIRELIHFAAAGTNNSVAVLNEDVLVIAREPWDDSLIGRNVKDGPLWGLLQQAPAGGFDSHSALDGIPRHYRYARIGDLPLVLVVGSPLADIYAGWWSEALAMGGVTTATIGLLLGLARALHLELARRHLAERIARDGAERFRILAENVSDIIVRLDLDGVRSYVSPSVIEVLGFTPEEMLQGGPWRDVVHPDDRPIAIETLAAMRAGQEQTTVVYRALKKNGAEVWLEAHIRLLRDAVTGAPQELIAVTRDVTARYASEQELKRLAATDGLTGLANRRAFDETLDREWRRATRAEARVALLMLDADYFKLYNDHYGHPAGDEVLRVIASCVTASIQRGGDLGARYGGEEFAVLLPDTELAGAVVIAERIRQEIEECAVPHAGSPVGHLTVSVGVSCLLAKMGDDPKTLVQEADMALYEAKRGGRNQVAQAEPAVMARVE